MTEPTNSQPQEYNNLRYDIIGDVHGYAGELKALLKKMGYKQENGVWQHPERVAIFTGDFTCRGPSTRESIQIVRNMVDHQKAIAILGNHELNVIGHFTNNKEGTPFKEATGSNKKIMDNIREEYKYEKKALKDDIKWLRRLPFYFDAGKIRVVHACWSDRNLKIIRENRTKEKLTKKLLSQIFQPHPSLAIAVRQTTRGIDVNLPHDLVIRDSKNIRRTNFRIKWWESPQGKTFRDLSYGNKFLLPPYSIPPKVIPPFEVYPPDAPTVFVGHYCVEERQMIPAPNVCCLDNCVANSGRLTAYRWNGEESIKKENFIFSGKMAPGKNGVGSFSDR